MFRIHRGVIQAARPPDDDDLLFLCWPVLVYRVTAPVVRVRHLNILEKVVLALCHAGLRHPPDIAARIHQNIELCKFVLGRLHAAGQLDGANAPTEKGVRTLLTSQLGEEPELIVTHVLQDPVTRRLWPRTADDLRYRQVRRSDGDTADLRLNTAGAPRSVTAHVVGCPVDPADVPRPTAQEIIDAVAAHRRAKIAHRAEDFADARGGRAPAAYLAERDLEAFTTELTMPSDDTVRQVLDVGRPLPEYLLLWWRDDGPDGGGRRAEDPFGLDPNPFPQRLLADRLRDDADLAARVLGFGEAGEARRRAAYRSAANDLRASAEARLVQALGAEIRRRPEALTLLLGLEDAAARGGDSGVEEVAREAYRLYEYLFRLLAREYPVPDRPSWDRANSAAAAEVVRSALGEAADEIGFTTLPPAFTGRPLEGLRKYPGRVRAGNPPVGLARAFVPQLVPYLLVAAADARSVHRTGHPLRDLAARRPALLVDLEALGHLRNRGSHAERDATVEDDIAWCRELALDAARLLITLPPPAPERNQDDGQEPQQADQRPAHQGARGRTDGRREGRRAPGRRR
ncbi:hypothetical protein BTM25_08640 [Actinomadura rubteroloni]|uniref:Uncharacterized protein n=1 Tax=Actinomadura rubteroloni TaxID=1926885 RepID=A0A2P4UN41_9ACTN|nr:hypothetical protein [Actinomadura rubteroloni]POM26463.1 hypothetical protein BTM25_08640 [Actinomadura rubteroloni]